MESLFRLSITQLNIYRVSLYLEDKVFCNPYTYRYYWVNIEVNAFLILSSSFEPAVVRLVPVQATRFSYYRSWYEAIEFDSKKKKLKIFLIHDFLRSLDQLTVKSASRNEILRAKASTDLAMFMEIENSVLA